jgi:hypothetical protein
MSCTATVITVSPGLESAPHAIVTIRVVNRGPRAVRGIAYRLSWNGGEASGAIPDREIAAGGSLDQVIRIGYDRADPSGLLDDPAAAVVTVEPIT